MVNINIYMGTDYASEFSRLFGGGCSVINKDWNAPRYFDPNTNDCYASEIALQSELTSEAYNNFGFEVQYYLKSINTQKDRLFGEDPLENVERRFKLQMYVDSIPNMQKQYELQGMIYTEMITCHCTIQHFYEASQLSYPDMQNIYEPEVPKIGDIVYVVYSDTFYQVVNVKEFADGTSFLTAPITYTFILRVWRKNMEDIDAKHVNPDKMEELRDYSSLGETFNLNLEDSEGHMTTSIQPDDMLEGEDIKPGADILSNNNDITRDTDLKYSDDGNVISEPQDNVESHVRYREKESKQENPDYYDPFEGW